jgi:UDP-N-acetylmuramate dehydrogenase
MIFKNKPGDNKLGLQESISLSDKTTMRVGGKARYYREVFSHADLERAVLEARNLDKKIFVLGGGSNVTISDNGLDKYVIKMQNYGFEEQKRKNIVYIRVGSALNWDDLVAETVRLGLQGIECLSGIPGTVGAAPVQNIGAYGQELKDTFHSLEAYDTNVNLSIETVFLKKLKTKEDTLFMT